MSDHVTWLDYDELAERLGITRESARRLVIRKHWARQKGNDGRSRIAVPTEYLPAVTPPRTGARPVHDACDVTGVEGDDDKLDVTGEADDDVTPPATPDAVPATGDVTGVLTRHVERLEAEITELRARAADRDAVAAQVDALRVTVQAMEASLSVERDRRADVEADRDAWRASAQRPLWRRLFG